MSGGMQEEEEEDTGESAVWGVIDCKLYYKSQGGTKPVASCGFWSSFSFLPGSRIRATDQRTGLSDPYFEIVVVLVADLSVMMTNAITMTPTCTI